VSLRLFPNQMHCMYVNSKCGRQAPKLMQLVAPLRPAPIRLSLKSSVNLFLWSEDSFVFGGSNAPQLAERGHGDGSTVCIACLAARRFAGCVEAAWWYRGGSSAGTLLPTSVVDRKSSTA